jgi:hypothetical protein
MHCLAPPLAVESRPPSINRTCRLSMALRSLTEIDAISCFGCDLFVLTGTDVAEAGEQSLSLQTSVKGVFAIGDVRLGSTHVSRRRWAKAWPWRRRFIVSWPGRGEPAAASAMNLRSQSR